MNPCVQIIKFNVSFAPLELLRISDPSSATHHAVAVRNPTASIRSNHDLVTVFTPFG